MGPEGGEDFIGIQSVLELLVELIGPSSICYSTVKPDQPVGEISDHHRTSPQLFMNYSSLVVVEEGENEFDIAGSNVGVGDDVLLAEEKTGQFKDLPDVCLADCGQIVFLDGEHRGVVLADKGEQQFREIVD